MKVSNQAIAHCRICFKEINDLSLYNVSHRKILLCKDCSHALKARFKKFEIGTVKALSIYEYDETIKKLIYTYKGCYDYELKDVFLYRYLNYLKIMYKGYVIVPAPSSKIDDLKRGFNHVVEIYKQLGFPIYQVIEKVNREKQSAKSKKNRLKIDKDLIAKNIDVLKGKKVLIVDDIYTTGATIFRCIELVQKSKPKKIKVLVIAKTIDLDKRQNS